MRYVWEVRLTQKLPAQDSAREGAQSMVVGFLRIHSPHRAALEQMGLEASQGTRDLR